MQITTFKFLAAISIFALSLVAGLLQLKIAKEKEHLLHLSDAFASGIFLSAALLHLLPEADHGFNTILGNGYYPLAQLIGIISFVLLLTMERCITIYDSCDLTGNTTIAPILLILLLSIHSLVEGAAIGINNSILETITIFFAVIAHKGSESFAFAANLHRHNLVPKKIKQIIIGFSLMTPLGIFLASLVAYTLQTTSGNMLNSVFNAIAAGTFLYLGTEHLVECKKSFETFNEILALILGIALMALVAIWV